MEVSSTLETTKPIRLKPSDICFSQKEIYHRFRRRSYHGHRTIGETLDDIVEGRLNVTSLPTISLKKEEEETDGNGADGEKKVRWITADNRRLWIFRHLERLGRCKDVPFEEVTYISSMKLSSQNRGASVEIKDRELPGGFWYQAPDVTHIDPKSVKFTKIIIPMSFTAETHPGVKVMSLVEKLECGDLEFQSVPSIIVWDDDITKRVIDGNRRLWAFQKANQSKIAAIVIKDRQLLTKTVRRMTGNNLTDITGYTKRSLYTRLLEKLKSVIEEQRLLLNPTNFPSSLLPRIHSIFRCVILPLNPPHHVEDYWFNAPDDVEDVDQRSSNG
ncbi:uncharacterized protein LOC132545695 [Ylistrum balloti]|uniref:uncharacterized protein LOC132545695 n=1 Tax=Ylistrum balloti TaxID=509963 RepID=UPI0029057EE1|nr:uncharacterized protein LOC132545695 [Ylistrum balloti]